MDPKILSLHQVLSPDLQQLATHTGALDPYLLWAYETRFRGYEGTMAWSENNRGEQLLSFLAFAEAQPDFEVFRNQYAVEVNRLYDLAESPVSRFFTCRVKVKRLPAFLAAFPTLKLELALPLRHAFVRPPLVEIEPPPEKVQGNLIAIIDDGCPVLNKQYRALDNENQTRIHRLWSQEKQTGNAWTQIKNTWAYSSELTSTHINSLLSNKKPESVNYLEALAYPLKPGSPAQEPELARATHGSHVLDLAGGKVHPLTEETDAASEATLMFVQLTQQAVRDSSGGSLGMQLLDALRYVLAHCTPTTGVVVNISYGTQAGPHDGSSLFERAMDDLMTQRDKNFAIVLGAGNSRQARAHAAIQLDPERTSAALRFTLPESDISDSFIEIWYSGKAKAAPQLKVALLAPDGSRGEAAVNEHVVFKGDDGSILAAIHHLAAVPTGKRSMALIALSGRLPDGNARHAAPPGEWKIEFQLVGQAAAQIDAWIERDDLPHGGDGRPISFDVGQPEVVQTGTLSNLATGTFPVVVGGSVRTSGLQVRYSSQGKGSGRPPDVLGPAEESGNLRGLRAGAVLSGQSFRLAGTSVAAPVVAREMFNAMSARTDANPVTKDQWQAQVLPDLLKKKSSTALGIVTASQTDPDD